MKIIITLILSTLLGSVTLYSQMAPIEWRCKLSKENINQGDEVELIFRVDLDDAWHLYSNIQDYILGPLPAVFEFEPHSSYKLLGEVTPIGVKTKYEPVFDIQVNYFENIAEFRQKVKVLSKNLVIKGFYEYQACNIVDDQCTMGADNFEFKIQTIK